MEMNMTSIIEHETLVVDLGAASVETKGAALDDSDNIGGQVRQLGIADD
ncbi:benenodin family lasso peptide [Sphingobium sp. AS12]|nr:benenodin family lasso peptide [Sphingobium sp. AS12]